MEKKYAGFFFFILDEHQKIIRKVSFQVQWHPRGHNFSPLITLFFLWMFDANIPSKEPALAHRSLSPEQQSVCTHVAKPWPFLSILLTRMLSSLVCSFLSWWTYFRGLVVKFHICLWCDGEPWGSVSSVVFEETLQRLCEMCRGYIWWWQAQGTHAPLSKPCRNTLLFWSRGP